MHFSQPPTEEDLYIVWKASKPLAIHEMKSLQAGYVTLSPLSHTEKVTFIRTAFRDRLKVPRTHSLDLSSIPPIKIQHTIVTEQFSNYSRKANTKVITPSKHKRSVTRDEPIECKAIACNLLKARENHAHTVLKYFFTSNDNWFENLEELIVLAGGMFTVPVSVRGSLTLLASALYYFPFTTLCNPHRVLLLSEDSHSH